MMGLKRFRISAGFTLLEVLVTVSLVGFLLSLVVVVSDRYVKRAKKVACMANMRAIHSGLMGYVTDHGHWPQMEEEKYKFTEEEFFGFWVRATEPYGISQETWICPLDKKYLGLKGEEKDEYSGSYVVTRFDEIPSTPFRWSQPWAMERGDFHGNGAHILMPDGSVTESRNPFHSR